MPRSVLADAGFLVALLRRRDEHTVWAKTTAGVFPPPWHTCEAALSETFHLLGTHGSAALVRLLRREEVVLSFRLTKSEAAVLDLMEKYASVPMSLADACMVRMTEIVPDPVLLTTDGGFRIYQRHSRQVIPCVLPS